MGKKDLTEMFGGGGGRTRQKYKCRADGCQVTPMGVNLSKHYKVNTDWVLMKELKVFGITLRMENLHRRYICNRKLQVVVFCYRPTKKGPENGANTIATARGEPILQILKVK